MTVIVEPDTRRGLVILRGDDGFLRIELEPWQARELALALQGAAERLPGPVGVAGKRYEPMTGRWV